jgi:hypothetical protein
VNAVLVSKDFGLTLVSPDDLNAYAPLYLTVCEDSIHTPLPLIFAFFFHTAPHMRLSSFLFISLSLSSFSKCSGLTTTVTCTLQLPRRGVDRCDKEAVR